MLKDFLREITQIEAYMKHDEIQKKYPNHVYFSKKGKGATKELKGNVVVIVLFVSDEKGRWTPFYMDESMKRHESAARILSGLAYGRGVDLKIKCVFQEIKLPMLCTDKNRAEWRKAIAKAYGKNSLSEYQEYYKKKYNCDEVPFMFTFFKDFRSYAISSDKNTNVHDEYSVLEPDSKEGTIIHELLHQFGAVDLYYPQIVRSTLTLLNYKSVMADSGSIFIDSLTAYLIGWTDYITEKGAKILECTKDYTREMMSEELKKEWGKTGKKL